MKSLIILALTTLSLSASAVEFLSEDKLLVPSRVTNATVESAIRSMSKIITIVVPYANECLANANNDYHYTTATEGDELKVTLYPIPKKVQCPANNRPVATIVKLRAELKSGVRTVRVNGYEAEFLR